MAVEANTFRYPYTGNGSTTAFPFPARFLAPSDIKVFVNDVQQLSGFVVTGGGTGFGGNVVFLGAPAAGAKIALVRDPPISQLTSFSDGSATLGNTVETVADRLTMGLQFVRGSLELFQQTIEGKLAAGLLALAQAMLAGLNELSTLIGQAGGAVYVLPTQFGAVLDGVADDTLAMQAWLDYAALNNLTAVAQPGVANIPTGTLTLSSGVVLDGRGVLTIRRTTNTVAALMSATSMSNIAVRSLTFETTAGFSATSAPLTMTTGSKPFIVPVGLAGVGVGGLIQITANGDGTNYFIGIITAYAGTSMTVNATTAVGSGGPFSAWFMDMYPNNGDLAPSNIALRSIGGSNVLVEDCRVNGRFYNGIDARDTSNVKFVRNTVSGAVNRPIHASARTVDVNGVLIRDNKIFGLNFSQYGVNISGTNGFTLQQGSIVNNSISLSTFQGVEIGGGVFSASATGNNITLSVLPVRTNVGVLVQQLGSQLPQNIVVANNTVNGAAQGVVINNAALFLTVTGNVVINAIDGFYLRSPTTAGIAYVTMAGNVANTCSGTGYSLYGALPNGTTVPNGVQGVALTGNTASQCTGPGFLINAGVSNYSITGNVSLNATGYNINGSTAVPAGGNV